MVEQTASTRADAIGTFAAVLRELRDAVGNPSFREMSGRSRAISHTTLHEAAQGNRLPSWSTTVEFVKACGADPADYRERWAEADRVVASATALRRSHPPLAVPASGPQAAPVRAVAEPLDVRPAPEELEPADSILSVPAAGGHRPRRWQLALGAAAIVVTAGVVTAVVAGGGTDRPAPKAGPAGDVLTSADCPVHRPNPPAALPRHAGDHGAFISDITLPDCTHVPHGRIVDKVWRLKNTGTVPWRGYSLHRMDLPQRRDQCQTITDVPIRDTAPGQEVDIRTAVTAPDSAGFCFVRFRMLDGAGAPAFPGGRPVNFQLVID